MENIDISKYILHAAKNNYLNYGAESYIYRIDKRNVFKIFKTDDKEKLENKLQKIIRLNELNIDFLTNPTATISCNGEFVGYKMKYDECDKRWFNTYLSFEEKIEYLEELKEKLLFLEESGILYPDIKDDNFLINSITGALKFCDVDNVQIDGLRVDTTQVISRCLRDEKHLFDSSIHAFMHNIYALEQLTNIDIYTMDDLVELVENPSRGLIIFNKNREQILENMAFVKKKDISNRYLIDNLK